MKKVMIKKSIFLYLSAIILCLTFDSCIKKLTPEERKASLETKITENDCKEITSNALQSILNNLRDIKYENVLHGVEEDIHSLNNENNYYISVVVSGIASGVLNGVDSDYSFYLYGRIPENLADKKEFDNNGYNLSLKKNGVFVYSNKEDVDSLNIAKNESLQNGEEMRKKDFNIGNKKVKYGGREGNALVFYSSWELTADEIADAVQNKIESEGVNMIQFYSGSDKYADYVYKTQCIIFVKSPGKIYQIIGGRPVKI